MVTSNVCRVALATIAVAVGLQTAAADDKTEKKPVADTSSYLRDDGQLKSGLTLRDAQSGFAGETGQLISIQPSGEWSVQKFTNEKLAEPKGKGKLSKEQLAELAQSLAQQDFAGLPKSIGKPLRANPRVVTVTIGKQSVVFTRNAGPLPKHDAKKDKSEPAARLAEVIRTIQKLVGEAKGR